jgi:hypothetical protein
MVMAMLAEDTPTTLQVTTRTRRVLGSLKAPGQTYDDLIQDLLEEVEGRDFYETAARRLETVRTGAARAIPGDTVLAQSRRRRAAGR